MATFCGAGSATAASVTWLNTGSTNANWNTSSNWVNGTPPGATATITGTNADQDIAIFNTAIGTSGYGASGTPVIIDSASENILGITFDTASAGAFVIGGTGGNPLYLTAGGTIQTTTSVANIETVNAPLTIEAAGATTSGTYTLSSNSSTAADVLDIGGAITFATTGSSTNYDLLNLAGTNSGNNDLSGTLTDASNGYGLAIQKSGTGTWTYGGNGTSTLAKGAIYMAGGAISGTFNFGSATEAPTLTISAHATNSGDSTTLDINGNAGTTFNMVNGSLTANSAVYGMVIEGSETYDQTGGNFSTNGGAYFSNQGSNSSVIITGGTFTNTKAYASGNGGLELSIRGSNTTVSVSGSGTLVSPVVDMTSNQTSGSAGSTVTLGTGGTISTGQIIQGNNTGGTTTFNFNGGTLTASAGSSTFMTGLSAANVQTGGAIINSGANSITIGQALLHSGSGTDGGLTKQGAGTLTLTGADTYNGATLVSGGILQLGSTGASGSTSGITVSNGAELDLDGYSPSLNAPLTLNGIGVSSAGALINSGATAVTYGGALTIVSGTVSINSNSGDIILSNTTPVSFNDSSATNNLNLGGSDIGGSDIKSGFSDSVGGSNYGLYINKSGAGTWTLGGSGTSTLTRATIVISTGTFNFGSGTESPSFTTTSNGAASSNAALNLNGGTFNMNAGSLDMISTSGQGFYDIGGNVNISGGTITMLATQGLILNSSQTYTQTSGTFTTNGRIELSNGSGSSIVNVSGGLLTTSAATGIETVRGTTTITLSSAGSITAPLLNMTTTQLSGGSAATTFNLNGGTLTVGQITQGTNGTTGSAFDFNGGTLVASAASSTFMTGITTANVRNGGAIINTSTNAITIGQALLHSAIGGDNATDGGLTKQGAGSLTLTGVNTYTGPTLISSGTLQIGAGTTGSIASSGTITDNGVLVFDVNTTQTQGTSFAAAAITGSGSLIQAGASTVIFNEADTYSGNTTINSGATLQVGAGGTGAANGSLSTTATITDNGALVFDRADTMTQGVDFSSAGISGSGSLTETGGALILNVPNSFTGSTTITSGTLTLTGSATLNNGSYAGNIPNSGVFNYNGTSSQTLSGVISNSGNLAKGGGYTFATDIMGGLGNPALGSSLTLSGSNTYSGTTTVTSGTIQLAGAAGALADTTSVTVDGNAAVVNGDTTTVANNNATVNRINSAATLTLGGANGAGAFTTALGSSGGPSQTLASLTINQGGDIINSANTAAGAASLIFTGGTSGSGYVRSTGGLVNFVTNASFTPSFTNAPIAGGGSSVSGTSSNAILIGAVLNGSDFVTAAAGNITAATYTASASTSLTAGANITLTGGNTTLPGSTTLSINSLKFTDNAARTLNLGSGSVLTIASGGILTSTAVATAGSTITSGTLTSGQGDLWIYANGSGFGNPRNANSALTISSVIADNAATSTPIALTVSGGEQVTLSGVNTYSGGTYLDNGFIIVNSDSSLGNSAGTVTAVSGVNSINPTAGFTFNSSRNFVVDAGAELNFGDEGQTDTIAGNISGGGVLEVGYVSNSQRLILTGSNSGFTGEYIVDGILDANEGVGLSSNANLVFVGRDGSGGAFDLGILETTGSSFTRSVGTGADQVQWQNDGQYASGGFAAVGSTPLTVNLGGAGATLTYGAGGFISATTSFTPSLLLGDANSTQPVNFVNPLNLNGGIRDFNVASTTQSGTLSGVLSGNSSSGVQYGESSGGIATGYMILAGPNTYAGLTSIESGTLGVYSLNHISAGSLGGSGSPAASSSLGAPTTVANGTISIGSTAFAGDLRYLGTGETTDRVINLAGTTYGATLDQSGSGLLDFTSNLTATGTGAKTLTLQGSTAGTGELDGAIVDSSSGSTSLTKAGTGAWTLTGKSTYTGATSVLGGTLIVSGSLSGTPSVAVNPSTLEVDGLINTAATISSTNSTLQGTGVVGAISARGGTVAPGLTLADASTSSGTLTAQGAVTLSGSTNFNVRLGVLGTTDSDQLAVTGGGAITLSGTLNIALGAGLSSLGGSGNPYSLYYVILNNEGSSTISGGFSAYTIGGNAATTANLGGGITQISWNSYTFDISDAGTASALAGGDDVTLELTAVPEPGTWAMLLAGAGMLFALRRRRRW